MGLNAYLEALQLKKTKASPSRISTVSIFKILEQVFQAIDTPVILDELLLFLFAISSVASAKRTSRYSIVQLVFDFFKSLKKALTTVSIRYWLLIVFL